MEQIWLMITNNGMYSNGEAIASLILSAVAAVFVMAVLSVNQNNKLESTMFLEMSHEEYEELKKMIKNQETH